MMSFQSRIESAWLRGEHAEVPPVSVADAEIIPCLEELRAFRLRAALDAARRCVALAETEPERLSGEIWTRVPRIGLALSRSQWLKLAAELEALAPEARERDLALVWAAIAYTNGKRADAARACIDRVREDLTGARMIAEAAVLVAEAKPREARELYARLRSLGWATAGTLTTEMLLAGWVMARGSREERPDAKQVFATAYELRGQIMGRSTHSWVPTAWGLMRWLTYVPAVLWAVGICFQVWGSALAAAVLSIPFLWLNFHVILLRKSRLMIAGITVILATLFVVAWAAWH
jgi:hypothetical protein